MAAILNFRIFRKIAKHKNAYILKTVLDRVISTKFLTHRVYLQSRHANFQKKIYLAKNGGHFTHLLKMSKCELSLKSIADSQFFSNNLFTYFWKSFHMVKFQTHS